MGLDVGFSSWSINHLQYGTHYTDMCMSTCVSHQFFNEPNAQGFQIAHDITLKAPPPRGCPFAPSLEPI